MSTAAGPGPQSPTALVTGASRGIGLAVLRMLVEEGYRVTAVARGTAGLEAAAERLGPAVVPVPGNVAREEDLVAVAQTHRERFGRLDVLVNNAGVGPGAPAAGIATSQLDLVLAVNLRAVVLLTRECAPMLLDTARTSGGATVVNVASIAGRRGLAGLSAYSAAKHGVLGYTEALNAELAAHGVRACAICPAYVDTPGASGVHATIPPKTMIADTDVAEAVRFLLRVSPACAVTEIVLEQSARLP